MCQLSSSQTKVASLYHLALRNPADGGTSSRRDPRPTILKQTSERGYTAMRKRKASHVAIKPQELGQILTCILFHIELSSAWDDRGNTAELISSLQGPLDAELSPQLWWKGEETDTSQSPLYSKDDKSFLAKLGGTMVERSILLVV